MPLSSDGTQYEIKIEWQEEPVLYKFVLDSGDWVLSNEQPTITDETGVVNHQLHVATELEAALGVALEPAQVKDGAGHVAPPESVEIPADIGEEIISKETPNDEYKPNSRPLSASGPGLVEDEDNRILAVAKSISPSVESHDSHLNPSAPAFNPAAQPFVPLSNPPRDTSRIPRSSRHQRSQSSSRTSHSRSSSIVSSRPRSGSSVHHDELNPTAHEFKPQFAQPTHIVPHASGYAAALKKPASPPMKEEFKKPQTPASKSGSPRSITSFPSTGSDSRGSQDADVRNGSSSSGTLSYAEMAKHAAAKAQVPGSALMSTDAEAQPPQEKSASIAKSVELNAENQSERTSSATSVIQQGTEQMAIPKTENISDNEEREPSADAKSAIGADPGPVPSKIIDDKATIEAVPGDKQTAHLRNDTSGTTRKSITADESDATKDDNDPNQGFGIETVARKSDGIPENENNASDLKEDLEAESVDEKNDVSPKDDIAPSPEAELCQEKDATVKPDSIEKSIFDVSSRSTEAVSNTAESVIGAAQERAVKVADTLSKASSVTSNEAGTESEKASNAGFHRNKPESPQADADNGVAHPRLDTIELTTEEYDPEQIRLMDEVCILLDRDDNPVGSVSKKDAHLMSNITEGLLHRAFSLFLFNSDRELLLQQRAAEKITFPDMWTNTCCSHPLSVTGEVSNDLHGSIAGVKRAAQRKVEQELGIQAADAPVDKMQFLTRIHYLAPSDGKWGEHEIDYILCLRADPQLKVNVNEVRDHKWVTQEDLRDMFMSTSVTYTPWFKLICETFLFRWWDNLEQLDICVDEPTIHRLGIDSALYDKITHTEDSPSLQTQNAKATDTVITDNSPFTVRTRASESTADTTQEAISGSEETITKIKEQTSEFISTATEKVLSAAGHASQTSDALMENVRSVLAPSDIVSEHDGANLDPETSEPAAEDALPVTSSNKPTTFDSGSTSTFTESTIQSTPKQVVDAHSEPAAEGSDLTLGEARDPVESEVQASFKATRDAEAPEPSNARESILELSPAGQAKVFAHTETTSISDISRPSTGKSVRVKPSFFLYIFNSLFGGLFSGFSTMFSKLAFWRKSPHHQHSD